MVLPNLIINEAEGYATMKDEAIKPAFYADCPDEDVARAKSLLPEEHVCGASLRKGILSEHQPLAVLFGPGASGRLPAVCIAVACLTQPRDLP